MKGMVGTELPLGTPYAKLAPVRETLRLEQMIAEHRPAVLRLCRHHEAGADARRDLEQEIWVAAWKALQSFREECSDKTFVLRIAHNVAITHVARAIRARAAARSAEREEEKRSPSVDETAEQRATLDRIGRRLRAMDLLSQELVLLALEGCSTAEIAEVTGLSRTNVTTRLSRLRHTLASEEGDER